MTGLETRIDKNYNIYLRKSFPTRMNKSTVSHWHTSLANYSNILTLQRQQCICAIHIENSVSC